MMASIGHMKRARVNRCEPQSQLTHTSGRSPMPQPPPTHRRRKPSLSLVDLCARVIVYMYQLGWLGEGGRITCARSRSSAECGWQTPTRANHIFQRKQHNRTPSGVAPTSSPSILHGCGIHKMQDRPKTTLYTIGSRQRRVVRHRTRGCYNASEV